MPILVKFSSSTILSLPSDRISITSSRALTFSSKAICASIFPLKQVRWPQWNDLLEHQSPSLWNSLWLPRLLNGRNRICHQPLHHGPCHVRSQRQHLRSLSWYSSTHLDHSRSKSGMVICIIIQIIVSLLFIVAVQIFDTKNFKFVIIGTYPFLYPATSIPATIGST